MGGGQCRADGPSHSIPPNKSHTIYLRRTEFKKKNSSTFTCKASTTGALKVDNYLGLCRDAMGPAHKKETFEMIGTGAQVGITLASALKILHCRSDLISSNTPVVFALQQHESSAPDAYIRSLSHKVKDLNETGMTCDYVRHRSME
ncbi:hypothetical protein EVAR_7209_1 [Eumeta japonica]|uniref:Uncharacterized protein n=1 Tax=Eumeta variegata TaxID=151549 RepID=A0A4C1T317_EUMVA|nr:hypothetical protein EVAR_7209_1 [Eumeta japonica]